MTCLSLCSIVLLWISVATIVVVGNVSIPIAVLAGVIEYDPNAVTVTEEAAP